MKKPLLMLLGLVLVIQLQAQSYTAYNSTGTSFPYDIFSTGTTVLSVPATDVLSSWQTLPFNFSFYGTTVTGYKVSDNGYITFDFGASTSVNTETALPNATSPRNAIFAFWDDWNLVSGTGVPDAVSSFTYGTAPNRVHVIQWKSVTNSVAAAAYGYMAIRLYECGDFDVVLNGRGTTSVSGTIGAQDANGTNGVQVSGSPAFTYPTSDYTVYSDDPVYYFAWSGTQYDMSVTKVDLKEYVVAGSNVNVTGKIRNMGSTAITSFRLNYSINGAAPVSGNITGVNIAPNTTYSFTHPTAWVPGTTSRVVNVCLYADNINGSNSDQRSCNDQICTKLAVINGTSGTKHVMIEEFTGAWCGYCPDGYLKMTQIQQSNPNAIGIAVHDGDGMEFADSLRTAYTVSSYPSGNIDRYWFESGGETAVPTSRSKWSGYVTQRMAKWTPVNVSVNHTWNAGTRTASGTISADFVDYAYGDLRFGMSVIEDSVTGTGSQYDQVNYYSSAGGAVGGSSHPYYNLGDPIVGWNHNHVLRAHPLGAFGKGGVIDTLPAPGSAYNTSFSVNVPAGWDENQVYLIGWVGYRPSDIYYRNILNSVEVKLVPNTPTSVGQDLITSVSVSPNPVSEIGRVDITVAETMEAKVSVLNLQGQTVAVLHEGAYAPGQHMVFFDATDVAEGAYFIQVKAGEKSYTRKVMVAH